MDNTILDCLRQERDFTFLNTLDADISRLHYRWGELVNEIIKVVKT